MTIPKIKAALFGIRLIQSARHLQTTSIASASTKVNLFDLNFDRRIKVDYKDSMNYLESEAYQKTYQGAYVWQYHKRNYKGPLRNDGSRPNCVNEEGFLDTSYPCPICRDEYLVIHPENTKLISQFINPHTGTLMRVREHGLCQHQYRNLIIAIFQARDIGTLTSKIPDRLYDYADYFGQRCEA